MSGILLWPYPKTKSGPLKLPNQVQRVLFEVSFPEGFNDDHMR